MEVYLDSSVHPPSGRAIGMVEIYIKGESQGSSVVHLHDTSSTVAEFQTFLHFAPLLAAGGVISVYSDCESLVKLLTGNRTSDWNGHRHADLYAAVVAAHQQLGRPPVHWIKGHDTAAHTSASVHKTRFRRVDRAARHILRGLELQ